MTNKNWITVGRLEDIPAAGARLITAPQGNIALFRTVDNQVYALDDRCPHRGGPLSQGMVYDHRVSCPLHNLNIDLESGQAVAPDEGCASHYPVRVENGLVLLLPEKQGCACAG